MISNKLKSYLNYVLIIFVIFFPLISYADFGKRTALDYTLLLINFLSPLLYISFPVIYIYAIIREIKRYKKTTRLKDIINAIIILLIFILIIFVSIIIDDRIKMSNIDGYFVSIFHTSYRFYLNIFAVGFIYLNLILFLFLVRIFEKLKYKTSIQKNNFFIIAILFIILLYALSIFVQSTYPTNFF